MSPDLFFVLFMAAGGLAMLLAIGSFICIMKWTYEDRALRRYLGEDSDE
jgi:hypothetical protein